jgi:hypothetical protein
MSGISSRMRFISDQQEDIVKSRAKYKLINGCAGSHKTDTLIKCAIRDLHKNDRPICFLTMVGTVTIEIKERLEKYLDIDIAKQGRSNHNLGFYKKTPICISNYDAWIHLMLSNYIEKKELDEIVTRYPEKVRRLEEVSANKKLHCLMKGEKGEVKTGLLIIDEVQDLQSAKMRVITNLARRANLDIYVAGDYLQTIFADDVGDAHAMNIFRKLNPKYFDLSICMRCPKAHIDFNNLLFRKIQAKYDIPLMGTHHTNTDMANKPVLFTHGKTSTNTAHRQNAEQITSMIRSLMDHDPTVVPGDIAIIMSKSRDNGLYMQLEDTLGKMYKNRGILRCAIYYMRTDGHDAHKSLDWKESENKTKMLSIHGDKGKGHRVVFLLGVTENAIPKETHIYKPMEIVSESLLNVGTTRSTQYLFIGFNRDYPSRYLQEHHKELAQHAYLAWNEPDPRMPPVYQEIIRSCKKYIGGHPIWNAGYKKQRVNVGDKSKLPVSDISCDYDHSSELIPYPYKTWERSSMNIKFGHRQTIHTVLSEDQYKLLGIMTELLIQRINNKDKLFKHLRDAVNNIQYTDDEQLLSCLYDARRSMDIDVYCNTNRAYLNINDSLEARIRDYIRNGVYVAHKVFDGKKFGADLDLFLSDTKNRKMPTESIWNVTLFYNQLFPEIYNPSLNRSFGYLTEEIDVLHANIDSYVNNYLKYTSKLLYEEPLDASYSNFTKRELEALNKDSHEVSIRGRCDIYNCDTETAIEIKASKLDLCSEKWIIQALCYVLMMNINRHVRSMSIVNMLSGHLWIWCLPEIPTFEDVIQTSISKKYNWGDIETAALISRIGVLRTGEDFSKLKL